MMTSFLLHYKSRKIIVAKSGCSPLDGLKLVYVGVGVRGPDIGCIFNNGADHHLITIALNRNRALVKIMT